MNGNEQSSIYRRKAAELRASLVIALQQQAGHPDAFADLMRRQYGVTDPAIIESLRCRARQGDLDWYPRIRFGTDAQLGGRSTRVFERIVMLSDAYVHANEEATRLFCGAARACFEPYSGTSHSTILRLVLTRMWGNERASADEASPASTERDKRRQVPLSNSH